MKSKKLFGLIVVLFFSSNLIVSANELCSPNGYTVITINGMVTTSNGAVYNKNQVRDNLPPDYSNEKIFVDYVYNATHLAGLGDFLDSANQKLFEKKVVESYDLTNMLNDLSQKVKTQKLLFVAHSQGNFYANNIYDVIASKPGGVPQESISIYGIGSPANHVAGNGKYITSSTDGIINLIRKLKFLNVLEPNADIKVPNDDDSSGHNLSTIYLKFQGDRIVSEIKSLLDNIKENDEQEPEEPCISPPELSNLHKIQGVILAVADPTAIVVKSGLVGAYDIGVYIANGARNAGLAIGKKFNGLFSANVIESLPNTDNADTGSVTTLLPDISEPAKDSPSQKQTPVNTKTTSPDMPPYKTSEEENIINNVLQPVVSNTPAISNNVVFHGGGGGGGNVGGGPSNSDTTAPIISIVGANPVDVTKGVAYTDAGATANDEKDGILTVITTGVDGVDTKTIGTFIITYTASDLSNNISTLTRTVNVIADTIAPVITIIGSSPEVVIKNSIYIDAGTSVSDNVDAGLTATATGVADVNTAIVGTYIITYSASDLSGNISTITRTIIVDDGAKLDRPNHAVVSGNYAYVVSENSNSLEIIDISNPATLVHKGSIVNGADGAVLFAPKAVAVSGNYAYVVSYSNALEIIDISNPVLPVHKSTLSNNSGGAQLFRPISIVISGNYAYIATNGYNNVEIVDISNPLSPVHKSVYSLNSLSMPSAISILGNYMYLTYSCLCTNGDGFKIVDISNPASPVLKSGMENGTGGVSISNPRSVFVSGNYAYIASWDTKSLEIVDISNPTNPVHKGKLTSGFGNLTNFTPNYVFVSGNYAYITSWVGETLEIVNISDPANPIHVGSLANGVGGSALRYPSSVFVSGNYAYISSSLSNAFEIIDISDPTNPIHKNKILNGEFSHTDPIFVPDPIPDPIPDPGPDITPPSITSYTLNGAVGNITVNPTVEYPLSLAFIASKNVEWVSIKIEKENSENVDVHKYYYPGNDCDEKNTCTQDWDGKLIGELLQNGTTYKIKVKVRDLVSEEEYVYLSPYVITVNTN